MAVCSLQPTGPASTRISDTTDQAFTTQARRRRGDLQEIRRTSINMAAAWAVRSGRTVCSFFAYEAIRNNSNATSTGWYDTSAFDALAPTGSIAATFTGFPRWSAQSFLYQLRCEKLVVKGAEDGTRKEAYT